MSPAAQFKQKRLEVKARKLETTQNIARIANAVPATLYWMVIENVETTVLNYQKCNQYLKDHKSAGLSSNIFVFVFFIVFVSVITCLKGRKSLRVLYGSVFQQCVVVSQSVS